MNPQELKQVMSSGLLSFPITDFDAEGNFRKNTYIERLEWLAPYGATALFAAGGTGEFFSLTHDEYSQVIKTAVDTCAGKVPILAGTGGPTRSALHSHTAMIATAETVSTPAHATSAAQEPAVTASASAVATTARWTARLR